MKRIALRLDRLETRLAPAVATWDGGGADNRWTTAGNWVGDVAPNPGDGLVFPAGAARPFPANDFPAGTAFHSIAFGGTGYHLTGNAVALAAGLSFTQPGFVNLPRIEFPLTLTADQAFSKAVSSGFSVSGPIDLNGHALTVTGGHVSIVQGPITGTGSLRFFQSSGGTLLTGENTFSGSTTVDQYVLQVEGTLPGPVTVQSTGSNGLPGTLSGTGTVGDVTVHGRLSPGWGALPPSFSGPAAGTLRTGNLSLASTAQTTFSILATLSTYPILNGLSVTGTVQLGGQMIINAGAYHPGTSDRFTLISNDGTDPVVGTFAGVPEGGTVTAGRNLFHITYRGNDGNDVVAFAEPGPAYAVGAGAGGLPAVEVYDANGRLVRSFFAYATAFRGGVRVATGDVTGDGVFDIITAPGPGGGPHVRVFDGVTFAVVREFMAYDPAFTGGVNVAASRVSHNNRGFDNRADIITGAGAGGGPHVKVFDPTGATVGSFLAYDPSFRGGVSVAGTDFTAIPGNAVDAGNVITGPGPGGGPVVRIFEYGTGHMIREFLAYDPEFRGGVNVAARGQLQPPPGEQVGTIVTSPASRGGPNVRLFLPTGQQMFGFMAYDRNFFGGVAVAVLPLDVMGTIRLVTGAGPGGGPHVEVWEVSGYLTTHQSFFAFDPAFLGGVFVG